jgi:hypothetical protein
MEAILVVPSAVVKTRYEYILTPHTNLPQDHDLRTGTPIVASQTRTDFSVAKHTHTRDPESTWDSPSGQSCLLLIWVQQVFRSFRSGPASQLGR